MKLVIVIATLVFSITSQAAEIQTTNTSSLDTNQLTQALKEKRAEVSVLEKILKNKNSPSKDDPKIQSCSGSNSCCCSAGSYGYCTTAKECADINATCTSGAAGC